MGRNKAWSKEEEEYLDEKWGELSIGTIAERLNRTPKAVRTKATKMKLGGFLLNGDYITFNTLLQTLGYYGKGYNNKWIEDHNFPVRRKRVEKRAIKIVNIQEFWKWAYNNQEVFSFAKFLPNSLGKEPKWVQSKREADILRGHRKVRSAWTEEDDRYLIFLLDQYQYTITEIANRMSRTEFAVERRIAILNIRQRPVKAEPIRWNDEKKEILKDMILKSRSFEEIAEKVGCSAKAAKNMAIRLFDTSNQDKIREILKNEKQRSTGTINGDYLV